MTQFQYLDGGNGEAQDKLAEAYLFEQASEGVVKTGVLSGLAVTQTTSASAAIKVGAGAGIVQTSRLLGADRLVSDTDETIDVLTADPIGALKRNDLVVFDQALLPAGIMVLVGDPGAIPADPDVPATAVPLARLRHDPAVSTTTIPASQIDDLREDVALRGALHPDFTTNDGIGVPAASATKKGKRLHWGVVSRTGDGNGYATVTHGCGFTPTVVLANAQSGYQMVVDNITSTTFRVRFLQADGTVYAGATSLVAYFCGE